MEQEEVLERAGGGDMVTTQKNPLNFESIVDNCGIQVGNILSIFISSAKGSGIAVSVFNVYILIRCWTDLSGPVCSITVQNEINYIVF